jgi:hypothetical protein
VWAHEKKKKKRRYEQQANAKAGYLKILLLSLDFTNTQR